MHLEVIAFAAGLISSTAAVPQIVRMIRTRKTSAVSTYMFAMKNMSNSLWIAFGIYSGVFFVVFWNVISLLLCTTVIVMKYRIIAQKKNEHTKMANVTEIRKVVDNTISVPAFPEMIMPKRPALKLVYSSNAQA